MYSAAVKAESPNVFVPRCANDGKFEKVQCQRSSCYCVDENGDRISGTSVNLAAGKPVCTSPGTLVILRKTVRFDMCVT